jgi:hypothetical protein
MLKLNVGFNRKVGEANFSSRGASVNLELELDSGLAGDPERLQDRIRQMFLLAKASVQEELSGQAAANGEGRSRATTGSSASKSGANGHAGDRDRSPRLATSSQIRALNTIADRQGLNLAGLIADRYALSDPSALTISQASELIDDLKGATNGSGQGGRR